MRDVGPREAHLSETDPTETDLSGVRGFTEDQIKSVKSLNGATIPDGTKYKPLDEQPSERGDISPNEDE